MPEPLPGDPLGVTVHRLKNGLTVYISENHQTPRVSAWIAVRAGSRNDPASSTGLAHYLEHMLFKGTSELGTMDALAERAHLDRIAALYDELGTTSDEARRSAIFSAIDAETQASAAYAIPNEFDQLYARLGITGVNAFTSEDATVYIADVPRNRLDAWARVEAARLVDPVFRLFYPELESVYEEKNRSMDDPVDRVFETMSAALFPAHPYGTQPTLGLIEHLKLPAYADMAAFFRSWYAPNNMAIVLAGDIDARTALPVLEKYFGALAPRPLPAIAPAEIAPPAGRTVSELSAAGESAVYIGWLGPAATHADVPVLEVMDALLANQSTGLLDTQLVLSQKLPEAGSYFSLSREAGSLAVYGTARKGQSLDEVEALLLSVVQMLHSGAFTQADVDAVVLHEQMRQMRTLEGNGGRVRRMSEAFISGAEWSQAASRMQALERVRKDDIIAAAKRYLGTDFVVVRRTSGTFEPPKIPKPKITPIAIDPSRSSEFARQVEAMPASPIEADWLAEGEDYERRDLPQGLLIAVPNRMNELFSLDYRFELGSGTEPLICFALELMSQSGTRSKPGARSAEELRRALYAMGTTIDTECGADELWLSISGVDRNLEASVTLLREWLRAAAPTEELRKKLVQNQLSQRRDETDEPGSAARALDQYAWRGKQSEYLRVPSNRALERAGLAALRRLLATLPDHRHDTFYFGPRAAQTVQSAVQAISLGTKQRSLAVARRAPISYRAITGRGTRIFFMHKEVAQSLISIAIPQPPLAAADMPLSILYDEYVGGGMGALIFQEIREARGLAYRAGGRHDPGERPGDQSAVIGILGTQSDKTIEALTTLLGLLRSLPVQPERLATAKGSIDAAYRSARINPRQIGATVYSWLERGIAADPRPAYQRAVAAIESAGFADFARRFGGGETIIAIMGDRSRIDMNALGALGEVVEVQTIQVFGY